MDNPTIALIVSRLPRKPLVNAREIADALGLATTSYVVSAIEEGSIRAAKIGPQYRIAREEAERWIRELEAK